MSPYNWRTQWRCRRAVALPRGSGIDEDEQAQPRSIELAKGPADKAGTAAAIELDEANDMTKDTNKKAKKPALEGEGSYSGTRGYNKGLAAHVRSADVAGLAKKAAKALDGAEGSKLRKAEKAGKAGPRAARSSKPARSASASR